MSATKTFHSRVIVEGGVRALSSLYAVRYRATSGTEVVPTVCSELSSRAGERSCRVRRLQIASPCAISSARVSVLVPVEDLLAAAFEAPV